MTIIRAGRRGLSLLLGAAFLYLCFWVWPHEARALGRELGWPSWRHPVFETLGAALIASGASLFAYCGVLFRRVGLGTPVPTDPPEVLVATGPYRWSRNPMFVAYMAVLLGETLWFGDPALAVYAALAAGGFHAIVLVEELQLRRKFGERYRRYARQVPRWLGRPAVGLAGEPVIRPGTAPRR